MLDDLEKKKSRIQRDISEYKAILDRINMPRWRTKQNERILREIFEDMSDNGSAVDGEHYPGLTTEIALEIYLRLMRRVHSPRYRLETIVQLIRDKIFSKFS